MPQSYTCLHYHFVFSTKNRAPLITLEIEPRLWEYLGGTIKGLKGIPIQIGGTAGHVHLLVTLRQVREVSAVVRDIKAASSGWIHDSFPSASFAWQAGCGAFTVSHSAIDAVREYIAKQKEHHKKMTYQDEFRALLKKHGIQFDEMYLWD
jgi:REP element-mobilizing transposase RayT